MIRFIKDYFRRRKFNKELELEGFPIFILEETQEFQYMEGRKG